MRARSLLPHNHVRPDQASQQVHRFDQPLEGRFLVDAIDGAEFITDFSKRCIGAYTVEYVRHQVAIADGRRITQGSECLTNVSVIPNLSKLPYSRNLPSRY